MLLLVFCGEYLCHTLAKSSIQCRHHRKAGRSFTPRGYKGGLVVVGDKAEGGGAEKGCDSIQSVMELEGLISVLF